MTTAPDPAELQQLRTLAGKELKFLARSKCMLCGQPGNLAGCNPGHIKDHPGCTPATRVARRERAMSNYYTQRSAALTATRTKHHRQDTINGAADPQGQVPHTD